MCFSACRVDVMLLLGVVANLSRAFQQPAGEIVQAVVDNLRIQRPRFGLALGNSGMMVQAGSDCLNVSRFVRVQVIEKDTGSDRRPSETSPPGLAMTPSTLIAMDEEERTRYFGGADCAELSDFISSYVDDLRRERDLLRIPLIDESTEALCCA